MPGGGRRGGDMYDSPTERNKMGALHGNSPASSSKPRTKIIPPPVGATSPEQAQQLASSSSHRTGRPKKVHEFDPKRRQHARDSMPQPFSAFGQDNLYVDHVGTSRNDQQRSKANGFDHVSSSLSKPSQQHLLPSSIQPGNVADKKKVYEQRGQLAADQRRQSTASARRSYGHDGLQRSGHIDERVPDSDDDSSDDSFSQPPASRAGQPSGVLGKHTIFPDDGDAIEVDDDATLAPPPPQKSERTDPRLGLKESRQRHERSNGAEASGGRANRNYARQDGPVPLEQPDEPGKTLSDPIELLSQDAGDDEATHRPAKATKRQQSAHASASPSLSAVRKEQAPTHAVRTVAKGVGTRMRLKDGSTHQALPSPQPTNKGKGRAADSERSTQSPDATARKRSGRKPNEIPSELALRSVVIMDFARIENDAMQGSGNIYLLPHGNKVVVGQGAGNDGRVMEIALADIAQMECTKAFDYGLPVVQLLIKPETNTARNIKAIWDEFDPRAVSDAATILLLPKFEDHNRTESNGLWDQVVSQWRSALQSRFRTLDHNAAETLIDNATTIPTTQWPQPSSADQRRNFAGSANALQRKAIRPGEGRHQPPSSPVHARESRVSPSSEERRDAQTGRGKVFNLAATPHERFYGPSGPQAAVPAPRSSAGAGDKSRTRSNSPVRSRANSNTIPPVKQKTPRSGNEQVLRFPYEGVGAVTLLESDLDRLDDGEFLNDTLIEFGLKLLLENIRAKDPALADQIYVFNSFFYKRLTENENDVEKGYPNVRKWTNKVDLFSKKYIVLPINEDFHWYLAVVVNPHFMTRPKPPPEAPPPGPARATRRNTQRLPLFSSDAEDEVAVNKSLDAPPNRSLKDDGDAMDIEASFQRPSHAAGQGRNSSAPSKRSGNRDERSRSRPGDGLSDVDTPPPPGNDRRHARGASGTSEALPVIEEVYSPSHSQSQAQSRIQGKKRDADGNLKGAGAETDGGVDSDFRQMSISPKKSAPPLMTGVAVKVNDLRTHKPAAEQSRRSPPAPDDVPMSDETNTVDNDDRKDSDLDQRKIGPSASAFELLDEEMQRIKPRIAVELTERRPDSATSLHFDDMTDNGYADEDDSIVQVRSARQRSEPTEEYQLEHSSSPPSQRPRHGAGSNFATPLRHSQLGSGAPGTYPPDPLDVTVVEDDTMDEDPLRGMRIGGGPPQPSDSPDGTARKASKITPGENRPRSPSASAAPVTYKTRPLSAKVKGFPQALVSRDANTDDQAQAPPNATNVNLEQTIVITFDSLLFARSDVRKHLRHYLFLEAKDKGKLQDPSISLTQAPNPHYAKAVVPKQPNYADCGIYLLHYFERFFSDPDFFLNLVLVTKKAQRSEWEPGQVSGHRKAWKERIHDLGEKWKRWKAEKQEEAERTKRMKTEEEAKAGAVATTSAAEATGSDPGNVKDEPMKAELEPMDSGDDKLPSGTADLQQRQSIRGVSTDEHLKQLPSTSPPTSQISLPPARQQGMQGDSQVPQHLRHQHSERSTEDDGIGAATEADYTVTTEAGSPAAATIGRRDPPSSQLSLPGASADDEVMRTEPSDQRAGTVVASQSSSHAQAPAIEPEPDTAPTSRPTASPARKKVELGPIPPPPPQPRPRTSAKGAGASTSPQSHVRTRRQKKAAQIVVVISDSEDDESRP